VTLVVTGNTISGQVSLFQRVPEFERHRMPLTGSRWDIRWLIGRRTKPTFCVFAVLSVAVMGKCCDASRDWEYYLISGLLFWRQRRLRGIDCRLTSVTGNTSVAVSGGILFFCFRGCRSFMGIDIAVCR
jgi:hypothetical protein